jgi:starvation-inducible DNA-binding protein
MIAELRDDNAALVARLKAVKEQAEKAGDNATEGLIDGWTDHGRRARVVPCRA